MRFFFALILIATLSSCYQGQRADLIVYNARIYSCDENFTIYEAMAVKDGKILQLGPEREILNGYDCDNIIDAQLKPVYPGFHDAHCHFWAYAQTLAEVDLTGSASWDEVCTRLVDYSQNYKGDWITGRGWDQTLWPGGEFPTNEALDSLFPNRPVLIRRIDGHAALANSKALEIAGVTTETAISGGEIKKNEWGKLTGILLDNAFDSVTKFVPEPDAALKLNYLQDAQYKLFEQGLTSINDAGVASHDRDLFMRWYANGDLLIKNYMMLFPDENNLKFAADTGIFESGNLTIRSFKIIADGAMGSRGACLLEPYHDDSANYGMLLRNPNEILEIASFAAEIGYQVNTHAIGDSANRVILKIYADVVQGKQDHRWKIEHAQLVAPEDFHFFETVRIIPSVQPTHCTSDMRWAEERLGKTRILNAYAYKKLLQHAGLIALGTDFPIENISPLETFYAAITRQDKSGNPAGGFYADQVLTREEALLGMTRWAAYSNFEEHKKGSLVAGHAADFVILTKDIMEIPAAEILKTFVEKTYLNGVEVYSAE
ncbi:MAG: amidohydrolase [Bacteroidetes bacterium]|nr:amidohydrolase [Bacteroidota bacterium]